MLVGNEARLEQVSAPHGQVIPGMDPNPHGCHRRSREDQLKLALRAIQAKLEELDDQLVLDTDLSSFMSQQREKITADLQAEIESKQREFRGLTNSAPDQWVHAMKAFATTDQITQLRKLEDEQKTQETRKNNLRRQNHHERTELHRLRLERVEKERHEQMLIIKKWAAAGGSPRHAEASSTQSTPAPSPGLPRRVVRRGSGQPRQDASAVTSLPWRGSGYDADTRLPLREPHAASPLLPAQQLPTDIAHQAKNVLAGRSPVVHSRHIPGHHSAASTSWDGPSAVWAHPSD